MAAKETIAMSDDQIASTATSSKAQNQTLDASTMNNSTKSRPAEDRAQRVEERRLNENKRRLNTIQQIQSERTKRIFDS
jgi:hypothetical protein